MIRLSELVNLSVLKEESHEEPTPTVAVDKKSRVEMKLKKLKEMQKKVDELLGQLENEAHGLDEKAKWRSSSAAVKISSPDTDDNDGESDDYHHDTPRSTGRLRSKADTPADTGSLSRRTPGKIATKGLNKGKLSASSASTLKGRIKSGQSTQSMTKNTKKVKNPKTGKDILATSAINDPSHPAYNAAKSALGKK